jgi:AbrB family looped-hinge helix DNA binding protein
MIKTASVWQDSVRVGAKSRITIPNRIASALRLKKGDQVLMRLVGRRIELIPIPKDQLWYWTPEWQRKEREVDEEIAHGRVKESASVDQLIKDLRS